MSATPDGTFTSPEQRIADLERQLAEREAELAERTAERDEATAERDKASAREAATAEVLQVINSSPGDLSPVFNATLEKAMRPCEANLGALYRFDGGAIHHLAARGASPETAELPPGSSRP